MERNQRVITITGDSGSGKTTLVHKLMERYPERFVEAISHTTREPRPGETNGKEYYFVSADVFARELDAGNFVEFVRYGDNLYGMHRESIESAKATGCHVLFIADLKGFFQIKTMGLAGHYGVFLTAPSPEERRARMRARGATEEEIAARERVDAQNDGQALHFDAIIVNDTIERAMGELIGLISG